MIDGTKREIKRTSQLAISLPAKPTTRDLIFYGTVF